MKLLQDKGLVGREPEEVAKFFHEDARVDRTAMGDYLGEGDEYVVALLLCDVFFLESACDPYVISDVLLT